MIDKKHIGKLLSTFKVTAEAGQLRFFAKAIGETNPIYWDEAAARAAGHPALPLAPTFLFSLEQQMPVTTWREDLGIVYSRALHGEESFSYHSMAYAGDTLQFVVRVADIYDRKGGALEFVVRETRVTNQRDEHIADLRSVSVQRNG
jgi:acyl dehydratase